MGDGQDQRKRVSASQVVAIVLASIAAVCGICVYGFVLYVVKVGLTDWKSVLEGHFPAIIGLPGAAVVAFTLVVFLRQTDGPLEFEGLGFKFKGASGQVAMWIACFLAITLAIKALWS